MLKESFKVYCAINDGIINLIDKVGLIYFLHHNLSSLFLIFFPYSPRSNFHILQFFEMPKHEAITSLEIYKRAGQQVMLLDYFVGIDFTCTNTFLCNSG